MRDTKRYYIETWGCQMNAHDSEKLAGVLESRAYRRTSDETGADVLIFNTCTIRDKAAHKFYTRLGRARRLKRDNPSLVLVVAGCVAQTDEAHVLERAPYVDVVLGTRGIQHLPELIEKRLASHEPQVDIRRYAEAVAYDPSLIARASRSRAYITVMEGCDKFCTFCIVPHTRGRETSRPVLAVVAEAEALVRRGVKEIMLLGQNVNSYRSEGNDFSDLLKATAGVEGLARLRFVTSHPRDFDERMVNTMAEYPAICKALHFPVQSGSDRVLERMRRGYTSASYMKKIENLRNKMPGLAVSTDVIVGFPGESEKDFKETLNLVREADFEWLYSFTYSPRRGTPAAKFQDQVSEAIASERLQRLQAMHRGIQKKHFDAFVGSTVKVLVEGPSKKGQNRMAGRTEGNFAVNLPGDEGLAGRLVPVRIEQAFANSLAGRVAL